MIDEIADHFVRIKYLQKALTGGKIETTTFEYAITLLSRNLNCERKLRMSFLELVTRETSLLRGQLASIIKKLPTIEDMKEIREQETLSPRESDL